MTARRAGTILILAGVLLAGAGIAVGVFGVEHEIGKIPAERRAQMTDFDWIGMQWIAAFVVMAAVGGLLCISGAFLLLLSLRRPRRS